MQQPTEQSPKHSDWSNLPLERATLLLLDTLHEFKREQFAVVSGKTANLVALEAELHTLFEQRRAELDQHLLAMLERGDQLRDKALMDASQQPDTLDARAAQLKRDLEMLGALPSDSVLARYVARVADAIPEQDRWEEDRAAWLAGQ